VELLLNQKREDMAQPAFSGMQELEFPELHEESVPTIAFLNACQKLMTMVGITDFTMYDVSKPDMKRLRRNISAVINFAKFREDWLNTYMEFTKETDVLATKKQQLDEERDRLMSARQTAEAARAQEAPEEARLTAENAEREVVVRDLFNKQTALQKESRALKSNLEAVQDQAREAEYKLLGAKEECDVLRGQIVPDPKKLKQEVQALHEAVALEKASIKALEAKQASATKQTEVLERAERRVGEVLQLQSEVEAEAAKLKEVHRQSKAIEERQARDEGERSDQLHQIKAATQRTGYIKERMEKEADLHKSKHSDALGAHADAQQQWRALHDERNRHSQQQECNEQTVRELRDKLLYARMDHAQAATRMQQLQQQLASQVRSYHETLASAMATQPQAQAVV